MGEYRAAFEFKLLFDGGVDGDAQHVAGEHVAGELDALKTAIQRAGQRLRQGSLADARNAFNQEVATGQQRHNGQTNRLVLPAYDAAQSTFQPGRRDCALSVGFGPHSTGLYRFMLQTRADDPSNGQYGPESADGLKTGLPGSDRSSRGRAAR